MLVAVALVLPLALMGLLLAMDRVEQPLRVDEVGRSRRVPGLGEARRGGDVRVAGLRSRAGAVLEAATRAGGATP